MELPITIEVWKKDKWFLAKTPELDFISQGKTSEEAKKNLMELIEIQFEEMREMGTLKAYLKECGFQIKKNTAISHSEMIGFEKFMVMV